MPELIKENPKIAEGPYIGPPRLLVLGIATAGGAGYMPVAPGTFGSAVGVLLFLLLAGLDPVLFTITLSGLLVLGIWSADYAERVFGQHDDGRIVIDEVVGQLVTLAPLLVLDGAAGARSLPLLAAGFFAFRLFDIWKPGPVSWAEKNFAGGAGVMLDDVAAGVLGAIVMAAISLVAAGSTP